MASPSRRATGWTLTPTRRVLDGGPLDIVFVCGGVDVRQVADERIKNALRRLARQGVRLGDTSALRAKLLGQVIAIENLRPGLQDQS